MTPDSITVTAGIISINGQPFLRFQSAAWAFVFLAGLGYACREVEAECWEFRKVEGQQ
jgi:hypothetical protein